MQEPPTELESRPSPASAARFFTLAWLCLAATIAYICRNSIGVAEGSIRADLKLSDEQMGAVMSAFYLTYSLGQVPSGWLAHIFGTRRLLPVLSALWSLATAWMAQASGFWLLFGARSAGGLAQAGIFPCSTNTVAKWFPETGRAFASGCLASSMSLGGAIGVALTGFLLDYMSWRWIFVLYGVPGALWALGFYLWFRERPEEHKAVNAAEQALIRSGAAQGPSPPAGGRREATPWLGIISSPAMWCICAQQFFRAAGNIFFASWFPRYLQEVYGESTKRAAFLTMMPLLAVVAGSLLGGVVSDRVLARTGSRTWARKGVATLSQVSCALLVFLAYFIHDPVVAVLVISTGTFCFAVGGPSAYSITIDMGGRHVAIVFSAMNMSGNLGAMALPLVVPWFQKAAGGWNSVLLLCGAMYTRAAVSWSLLRPEGTIFMQSLLGKETQE